MRLRHVAPAGTPIGLATLAAWTAQLAGPDPVAALAEAVRARTGTIACVPTVTGRTALVLILRALASLRPVRTEVVVPSYTCYTVVAAVISAGLHPRVVDIDPATLDLDRQALAATDLTGVLAIVATNLFGLPSDLPFLSELARAHGCFLVDDAAQAMGASIDGRASGTWGEAGLYSLDKGKNITAIEGGLAVTRDPQVAEAMRAEANRLQPPGAAAVGKDLCRLLGYAAFLHPWLYGLPNSLPFLSLGTTPYLSEIPYVAYNRPLAAMGLVMLRRLDSLNASRRRTAARLAEVVAAYPRLTPVRVHSGAEPVYLRYPLLARDRGQRDALVAALTANGIGATGSYPTSLVDIPELAELMAPYRALCPAGRDVAERIVTLPTHHYVTAADVETIRDTLHATLDAAPIAAALPGAVRR